MSEAILYGLEDSEIVHTNIDDALKYHFDDCEREELPATVTINEFQRMKVSVDWSRILEEVYEGLDEKYGDPDGEYNRDYPDAVTDAAKALGLAIEQNYQSWACEMTGKAHEVNMLEWWDDREGGRP